MVVAAVMADRTEEIDALAEFREHFYQCMARRTDALFELTEALLCTDGPVKTAGRCRGRRTAAWPSRWTSPRDCASLLIDGCQWHPGDRDILIVLDAGYEAPHIAWLLRGLPREILGRMRSDQVLRRPTPPRVYNPRAVGPPNTAASSTSVTPSPGRRACGHTGGHPALRPGDGAGRDRLHPRLTRRAAWADHDQALPIIAGTVIQLTVDHLPSRGEPKPLRLWWSKVDADHGRSYSAAPCPFARAGLASPLEKARWRRPRADPDATAVRNLRATTSACAETKPARPRTTTRLRPIIRMAPSPAELVERQAGKKHRPTATATPPAHHPRTPHTRCRGGYAGGGCRWLGRDIDRRVEARIGSDDGPDPGFARPAGPTGSPQSGRRPAPKAAAVQGTCGPDGWRPKASAA